MKATTGFAEIFLTLAPKNLNVHKPAPVCHFPFRIHLTSFSFIATCITTGILSEITIHPFNNLSLVRRN